MQWFSYFTFIITDDYSLTRASSGRVIVNHAHSSVKGSLCADGFNNMIANVTCKGMGYFGGIGAEISAGSYPKTMASVSCTGTENSIRQCNPNVNVGGVSCGSQNIASVTCCKYYK